MAETELVASVLSGAIFTATPDGQRIAVLPIGGDDVGSPSSHSRPRSCRRAAAQSSTRDDGSYDEVETAVVTSFSWDPTGERLLVLEVTDAGAFRWRVWEDGESHDVPRVHSIAGIPARLRPVLRSVRPEHDVVVARRDCVRLSRARSAAWRASGDQDLAEGGSGSSRRRNLGRVVERLNHGSRFARAPGRLGRSRMPTTVLA